MMMLSLAVWLGGIIFFSFVVAPDVFGVLTPLPGGRHLAGEIVNQTLGTLQWIGLVCGVVFLAASTALLKKLHSVRNLLVAIMMGLTGFLIFSVAPNMEKIRASNPRFEKDPAAQASFNSLHNTFVSAEATVLAVGLAALWLSTNEPKSAR